jgi:hypothetical protein
LDLLLDGTTDVHSPISAILQQYRRLTKMAAAISSFFRQSAWIPNPELTEKNLPNQAGRVFIVTGGYAGIGYELSKILYQQSHPFAKLCQIRRASLNSCILTWRT